MTSIKHEKILITVKTYPTLSKKYGETVCTAGIKEDGTWVRIYPVPFRRLEEAQQYKKYDWINCRLSRNASDLRPESMRPVEQAELITSSHVGTSRNWLERRRLILNKCQIYDRLDVLIDEAKNNITSLAVFRPTRIKAFIWEKELREWDIRKLEEIRRIHGQGDLFSEETWRKTFKVIRKLPYSFSYKFEDAAGRESTQQILDWEIGALYWNCLKGAGGNEEEALEKVREKYFDSFTKMDLHFFLGTTQQWHLVAPNPWVIIGVFPIPHEHQEDLF